jgi:hypothetical protein
MGKRRETPEKNAVEETGKSEMFPFKLFGQEERDRRLLVQALQDAAAYDPDAEEQQTEFPGQGD